MLIATALLLGIASPSLAGRLQDQAQKTEPILLAPRISKAPTGDYNVRHVCSACTSASTTQEAKQDHAQQPAV